MTGDDTSRDPADTQDGGAATNTTDGGDTAGAGADTNSGTGSEEGDPATTKPDPAASTGEGASTSTSTDTSGGDDSAASSSGTTAAGEQTQDVSAGTDAKPTSTGGGGPTVEVKLRVFIPCRALKTPKLAGDRAFAGDGRDFSYDSGGSRAEIVGQVTVGVPGHGGATKLVSRQFGLSEEYKSDDTTPVAGKPDWFLDLKPGYTVIDSDTQTATDDHLNFVGGAGGSTKEAVFSATELTTVATITVSGALPLMKLSPAIDADLYVHFKVDGGALKGLVNGAHDGFPAYELYFNQQLAYKYDPVAAGASPINLMPPEDVDVGTSYIDLGPA